MSESLLSLSLPKLLRWPKHKHQKSHSVVGWFCESEAPRNQTKTPLFFFCPKMGHEDWDLSAIVRSCKTANNNNNNINNNEEILPTNTTGLFSQETTTSSAIMHSLATANANQENGKFSSFPDLMQSSTNGFQELHQLFVTFNPTTTTSGHGINPNSSPFPDFTDRSIEHHHHSPFLVPTINYTTIGASTSGSSFDRVQQHQQKQQQPQQQKQPQPRPQEQRQHKNQPKVQVPQTSGSMALSQKAQSSQTPRSRKRKSLQKKMVCHVAADKLSADLWAWRKYGQKPIKGSPYPRNYYRCSSCKGCSARKQVERSLIDPGMFVITYTGEHRHAKPVHRNSLAGITRNKTTQPVIPTTHPDPNPETSIPSHHDAPVMNPQGGQNNDVEGYTNINAEDSGRKDDPLAEHEVESWEDEEEEEDVLIPNDTASAALSDTLVLYHVTFDDAEGKNIDNIAPG